MKTHLKLAAGAMATLGLVAIPASASAAGVGTPLSKSPFTITTTSPFAACYDTGASLNLSLTGGGDGDDLTVQVNEKGNSIDSASGSFDSSGDATVAVSKIDPYFLTADTPIEGVPVTVSVEDFPTDGSLETTTPVGSFLMTQIGLTVSSTPRSPSAARAFAFSGAYADSVDYGFITNSAGTKVLRKFVIGRSNACGYVRGRHVIAPVGAPRGSYRFYVYGAPVLDKRLAVGARFTITRTA